MVLNEEDHRPILIKNLCYQNRVIVLGNW